MSFWDETREQRLAEMWAMGLSASQIGAQLGCTRNAVIGKRLRMGIPDRAGSGPRKAAPRRVSRPARRAASRGVAAKVKSTPAQIKSPTHFPAQIDDVARVSLLDLEHHHCRWPVGDPSEAGFGFCGLAAHAGPYCAHHMQRAFREFVPQERRPRHETPVRVNKEFA